MAAVPFGQYAHSNQPVHHVLYLFAVAGRSDRLQYWVRRVLAELYTVETFAGDEDTGSMSAWFLMSAMGFYPLCPGKAEYVIGAPLFDRVTLKLAKGAVSVIEATNNSMQNCFVRGCTLNGKPLASIYLAHADVVNGMNLKFDMAATGKL
jgi:putative alpha-1,2-mannosidase